MKGKILGGLLAVTMILTCSTALAEMPLGTVVIDGKGYSMEYINAHPKKFRLDRVRSLLYKLPDGSWVDGVNEKFLQKSEIPEVEYWNEDGKIKVYAKSDGKVIEERVATESDRQEVIEVWTSEELSEAIGSNRRIILREGLYKLLKSESGYVKDGEGYNNSKIVIDGVENLIIEGEAAIYENGKIKYPTELGVDPELLKDYAFVNCKNITLKNIGLASVQIVEEWSHTSNITVDNCEGVNMENMKVSEAAMGMILRDSKELSFKNFNIEKSGVMVLTGNKINNMKFIDCKFSDNKNDFQFVLSGCNEVVFEGCKFINNDSRLRGSNTVKSGLFLISDADGIKYNDDKGVTFEKCLFKDNDQGKIYLNTSKISVNLIDNEFSGNGFKK